MLSCFSHVQLFAIPWTVWPARLLCRRILQARILEWVAMPRIFLTQGLNLKEKLVTFKAGTGC